MSVQSLSASVVGVDNVGLGVRALDDGVFTEVLESLPSSGSSEEDSILAEGSYFRELVEGQNFTSCLDDSSAGLFGHSEGANSELGNGHESLVVEDISDDNQDFVLLLLIVGELGELGDGNWVPGGPTLVESLVDDLVELGLGSSAQELIELDQESMVEVGCGGVSADLGLDSAFFV